MEFHVIRLLYSNVCIFHKMEIKTSVSISAEIVTASVFQGILPLVFNRTLSSKE